MRAVSERSTFGPPKRNLALPFLLILVLLAPALLFGYVAVRERIDTKREAASSGQRTAWVIREHALKVFETHEIVLGEIERRIAGKSWDSVAVDPEIDAYLQHLSRSLPHVAAIVLSDADGRVRASSHGVGVNASVAGYDYFPAHRNGHAGPYISAAYASPHSGERFFSVSIGKVTAEGRFDGVLSVEVSLRYFTDFWRQFAPTIAYIVPMIRDDGELLVRYPVAINPQRLDPNGPFLQAARRSPDGVYTAVSRVDGVERMNAYTRIGTYPLFVSFSVETGALLGRWRTHLAGYALLAAIATAALLAMMLVVWRHARRDRVAAAAWQEVATRLEAEMKLREAAEETLRQAQKLEAIGQITGGVAHDFNNLLQGVTLNLHLIAAAARDNEPALQYARGAMSAVDRGAQLTQQLLAFARRQPLTPQPTDVNELISRLTGMLQRTLGDRVQIEIESVPDLWPAMIDSTQCEMALLNLALNSRDAMPGGGTLTFHAANFIQDAQETGTPKPGEYVRIAVADTGAGMAPEIARRAFEPFFTTKDVGRGSGLGLSQVHGFAVQSGGAVSIHSRVGQGTTVSLYLPRARVDARSAPREQERPCPSGAGETVLIVDDEPLVRASIAATLREQGYRVLEAGNGAEAVDLLASGELIDLLITDYAMPGLRGSEVARTAIAMIPGLRVLIITGYADDRDAGLDAWKGRILRKPFTPAVLAERVHDALSATGRHGKVVPLRPLPGFRAGGFQ